jgi:hypothetical protein
MGPVAVPLGTLTVISRSLLTKLIWADTPFQNSTVNPGDVNPVPLTVMTSPGVPTFGEKSVMMGCPITAEPVNSRSKYSPALSGLNFISTLAKPHLSGCEAFASVY